MTPRFDPAGYPGERPAGPVLVSGGRTFPVAVDGDVERPWRRLDGGDVPRLDELRLCVAYGANAAPDRLVDKRLDRRGAMLLPARLPGWATAFEARRTGYGAVPLTLVPSADPAQVTATWVLGVHVEDLAVLDRTEGRAPAGAAAADTGWTTAGQPDDELRAPAGSYVLGRVGPVAVAERFLLADALAYRPGPTTHLLRHGDGWLTWPRHRQPDARAALTGAGRRTSPAAPAGRVETGAWPLTPLADPPVFAYGTVQPERSAFSQVADLVDEVGPAVTTGRLHDTGQGYSAARFDGHGRLHGILLQPGDADAAATLIERLDRYEGVPDLFRRRAVWVTDAVGDRRWALGYEWSGARLPGRWLPAGSW